MGKFLFTMWPANDLGLPSRLVPIARLLADRGHEVAMYNPTPAPANLIASAGFGGHGAVMTGLLAGTPAVIIPTISEREGNARCVAALGAGEVVLPSAGAHGEKEVNRAEFRAKVERVLNEPVYRRSAERVAESMRKYGGAREAADRIEKLAAQRRMHRADVPTSC